MSLGIKRRDFRIKVLTELFDNGIPGVQKISMLKEYGINLTRELEGEVTGMCTYADSIERKGIEKGREEGRAEGRVEGREEGLQALISSLSGYIKDFDSLYSAVTQNDVYKNVTREGVLKYYNQ